MKESTAKFIYYNLRPSKQTERRLLLDFLKCAAQSGMAVSDYRYVGMGGTMFYDFHLMHRFLGINYMVSLERNKKMFPRAKFNCPFDFIEVRNESVARFLAKDKHEGPTIFWLDYDDGLGPAMIADIMTLGVKLKVGDFGFVTAYGQPPGVLERASARARLDYFQDELGHFSTDLDASDMENANFPSTVHAVLVAAMKNAFAARDDATFYPLFQVQYRDSVPMVTIGGLFNVRGKADSLKKRMRTDLPFLSKGQPYKIDGLPLTESERVMFDKAVTMKSADTAEMQCLKALGFKKRDLDSYRDLLRFLPRYHESIV